MADETYGFTQARVRLEEIVSSVRKKDTSLEKSLDLLEEGVRLANQCTELIDHADWEAAGTGQPIVPDADAGEQGAGGAADASASGEEGEADAAGPTEAGAAAVADPDDDAAGTGTSGV